MPSRSDNDEYDDEIDRSEEDQDLDNEREEEDDNDEEPRRGTQRRGRNRLAPSPRQTRRPGRPERSKRPAPAPPPSPPPTKRRPGRPKGSKNKPKAAPAARTAPEAAAAPAAAPSQQAEPEKPMKPELKVLKGLTRAELIYMTYKRPIITLSRALTYVGPDNPPFGANWTHADERALRYDGSAEKFAISRLNPGSHSRHLTLWKICLSVCQRSPFDVLSSRRGLCYLPSKITDATSSVVWDQNFCRELADIISHPIWNRDIDVLVTILQYAVICRTDDRRRWQVPTTMIEAGPTVRLRTEMQSCLAPLPTYVHELHKYIRDNTGPDVVHCQLSNFMMAIAHVVSDRVRRGDGREARWSTTKQFRDGYNVYGVTIADLGIIKEAILRFTRLSTVTSFGAFSRLGQLPRNEITIVQLRNLMRRAWLQEKRRIHRDRRLNGGRSPTQSSMVVVVPAVPDSRRDEFEEWQDEVMSDSESLLNERTSNQGVESEPAASPSDVGNRSDDSLNTGYGGASDQSDDGFSTGYGGGFDNLPGSPVASGDHDMSDDLEMPQNDDPRPESPDEENAESESNRHSDLIRSMPDGPLLVEPLRSTPPGDPVNETDDGPHDPDQPLPTVESPDSASMKLDGPRPEPLPLRPLNTRLPSRRMRYTGPSVGVISWRKDRRVREEKDREAMTKLFEV
ncbi:hypothetical protein H9Q70_009858 [Fusarium xylarioides]|nr:hypothetical protein H9Q70_009858 [Fusarium xylarioides]KAG5776518.1 hypothetical protein H9Q73_009816 [Fusarium xylarioides]